MAGSGPWRYEQGVEPGLSLLRLLRGCKVHTEVRDLMYFVQNEKLQKVPHDKDDRLWASTVDTEVTTVFIL